MSKKYDFLTWVFFIAAIIITLVIYPRDFYYAKYTMVDVCHSTQGEANLIQFKNDINFLIDVGCQSDDLVNFLRSENITKIDKVFITHAHKDHIGGLRNLVDSGIVIGEVYMSMPDKKVCDSEIPWGCDYSYVTGEYRYVSSKVNVSSFRQGLAFTPQENIKLEVIFIHDGVSLPIGQTDLNDTAPLIILNIHGKRVFFAAEINKKVGVYLVENKENFNLESDILKFPHHGAESYASNEFLDLINPRAALVAATKEIWASERTSRAKEYFESRNINYFVNGINGNITVQFDDLGNYFIESEK